MNLAVIILILSSISLIPTIIVLFNSAITWKKKHHFFLASFFISVILYYLPFLLSYSKTLRYVPYFLKSGIIFNFMNPGLLLLYFKFLFTKSFHLKKIHLLYLIAPFIALLDYLYFHIKNNAQLDDLIKMVENNSISLFKLEGFIPFEINLILRFVYVLPFGYHITKIFTDKKNKPFLIVEDKTNFTFIKILLTAILYAYFSFFIFLILPLIHVKINFSDSLIAGNLITAGVIILFLGMKILLSPQLLFDLKENKKKNVKTQNETKEEAIELLNRIETKMSEEKFYLNEKFSSNDVLTNFEITRSNLDDLLIQIKGINFADWLNNFRIEYSKNLLLFNDQYTIDALSNMSGFSSRSAFYAAFKKKTNITPSEYIKQSKKEL